MYNRYIPQSDGSYRRNRVQDNPPEQPAPVQIPQQQPHRPEPQHPSHSPSQGGSVDSFLKKLLPKEFDTGDLLVVLLLLLMAEHCDEEKNTSLLTLALYFFM